MNSLCNWLFGFMQIATNVLKVGLGFLIILSNI